MAVHAQRTEQIKARCADAAAKAQAWWLARNLGTGSKALIGCFGLSLGLLLLAVLLRLSAHSIAWPSSYSFSGPREATSWGVREAALIDVATGLFLLGGAILIMTLYFYLGDALRQDTPRRPGTDEPHSKPPCSYSARNAQKNGPEEEPARSI